VRYDQVNAMLLNEFLKEHRKMEKLEASVAQQRNVFETSIDELKKEMDSLVAHSKEQDAKIQKVSTEVELNKAGPQAIVND
jgi:peptidoglycan hydrolase CwlO-like protein